MKYLVLMCLFLAACGSGGSTSAPPVVPDPPPAPLPRVLVIGDILSMQWYPYLAKDMAGIAQVEHAYSIRYTYLPEYGGFYDGNSADEVEDYPLYNHAEYVYFDAPADIDPCHAFLFPISINASIRNLSTLVDEIRASGSIPIYGTIPPSNDPCHDVTTVMNFNKATTELMQTLGVTVVDEWGEIYPYGQTYLKPSPSVLLTDAGDQVIATSVQSAIGYIPR